MYLYLLVGLPGSGKSTFRKHLTRMHPLKQWVIVSSDDFIDAKAKAARKTYTDVFDEHKDAAEEHAMSMFKRAVAMQRPIIIDRTNLTRASRRKYLEQIPQKYRKTCVILSEPSEDELRRRLDERKGKIITDELLANMRKCFERPTTEEGFDLVYDWPVVVEEKQPLPHK